MSNTDILNSDNIESLLEQDFPVAFVGRGDSGKIYALVLISHAIEASVYAVTQIAESELFGLVTEQLDLHDLFKGDERNYFRCVLDDDTKHFLLINPCTYSSFDKSLMPRKGLTFNYGENCVLHLTDAHRIAFEKRETNQ